MERTRRSALTELAAFGTAGLAGCLGGSVIDSIGGDENSNDGGSNGGNSADGADGPNGDDTRIEGRPPTAERDRHLAYDEEFLLEESLNGGVGQDGIPSVDDPTFKPIEEVDFAEGVPVFGVARNGEAKAYPQYVVSWHEIVNDTIAGDPVSVTYCPLTGTVQGFHRGGTTFGVSGELVNSNLIMYDRQTESWWPQMLATAIDGPMTGETLREFRVIWTTADEWAERYPDSLIMTDETGYARRYENDPYGGYAPLEGYYARDSTTFPPLNTPDVGHMKSVVIGARTDEGAIAFDKETLLADRVRTGSVGISGSSVVAVVDPGLSTAYVYENPDESTIEPDGDTYRVESEGDGFEANDLPLDRILAFDAMWFAWAGFYPDTAFVGEHTEAGYGR